MKSSKKTFLFFVFTDGFFTRVHFKNNAKATEKAVPHSDGQFEDGFRVRFRVITSDGGGIEIPCPVISFQLPVFVRYIELEVGAFLTEAFQ